MTILVIGDANADLSATLSRFPFEGDDSPVDQLAWSSGGSAANVAVALALLGLRSRLLARVGCDPAAKVALQAAREAGVDLAAIQRDDAVATGLCFAGISPNGERTLFSFRGANVALTLPHDLAPLNDITWLHIAGHALLERPQRDCALAALAAAEQRGIRSSLDLCLPLLRADDLDLAALLPRLQIVFANEAELSGLLPGASQHSTFDSLRESYGASAHETTFALKLGPRGCVILSPTAYVHTPSFTVAAIDTTGCGDAFVAGFLWAYLANQPVEQCAMVANAVGALTATRGGAAEALPSRAEVQAFLDERRMTR